MTIVLYMIRLSQNRLKDKSKAKHMSCRTCLVRLACHKFLMHFHEQSEIILNYIALTVKIQSMQCLIVSTGSDVLHANNATLS